MISAALTSAALTSEQLLFDSCHGDEAAFGALYHRMYATVFETVRSVLRDPDLSEEVAQEVLLEAWLSGSSFDAERAQVSTWLKLIAKRRAIDRVRAVQSSRVRDAKVGLREWFEPADDVMHGVETRLEFASALRALAGIPNPQRRAIELSFVHGHTRAEVAWMLGVPLSTANWHIRNGLAALRTVLEAAA
ncbi:sigma-70 family RNA polymerase sigma factor [Subtercola lobariae]|uniref:RNA polymerase sigma factor n=1 Tax=Subtercola lobariae TaxID=1588641 RepID=A0A917B956_9MICO|nr:sigma-70 family RNA polymerase sigma factor [Subtercola lobariae]GGF31413.1 RNA polymerase sigma factor SigK [Subtercola lobariae]